MKSLHLPYLSRDSSPVPFPDIHSFLSSRSNHMLQYRGLAPTSLALVIIIPVACVGLVVGTLLVVILRRRRRLRFHQNSPTTSMVRNSLEEDLASYRQERRTLGEVVGPVISQEDLQIQLRGPDHRMSTSSILTGNDSRRSSRSARPYRHENSPKSEVGGLYSPPGPVVVRGRSLPASRVVSRDPSRGSRPASGLRHSVKVDTSSPEKDIRGYYEPEPSIPNSR